MVKLAALTAVVAAALLTLTGASALAASPPYVQVAEIPSAGSEFFSESVAVDPHNGHIYVADSGAHVIRDYASTSDTSPTVWNGSTTPAGEFTGKLALAIENATGDVYVADSSHAVIDKFDEDGNLITSFGDTTPTPDGQLAGLATPKGFFSPASTLAFGIAVDQTSGHLYVIDAGPEHEVIDAFTAEGEYLPASSITEKPGELYGCGGAYTDAIAVNDTTGELLVTDSCDLHLYRFELATGAFLGENNGSETPDGSFGNGYISVAVDQSNGNVFVADSQHAVIDEFTPALVYAERQVKFGPSETTAHRGVGVDPQTGDVYAPDQERQAVRVFQIKQPDQPLAVASVSEVTATSATLRGSINPEGLSTTYHFEYISQADWQANGESFTGPHPATVLPVPDLAVGSGEAEVQTAPQPIGGLVPGATFRYRLLATNSLSPAGGTLSPEQAFTTQPTAAASLLPDSRGYELVSPPLKQGVPLQPISLEGGVIQAAADGSAIAYFARGSIVSEPAGNRSLQDSQFLAARGAAGWSTRDVSTPHQHPAGTSPGIPSEYKLFSSDLSLAALEPNGATPLSPQASERTPYLRAPDGSYTPLVYPGNVPLETEFGGKEFVSEFFPGGVKFVTATPDLSHLLLESPTSLVEGFENEDEESIYEWSGGALTPVSYVPSGAETRCGGAAPACVSNLGAKVGIASEQVRGAISADGSRVFFEVGTQLFLRDIPRGETLLLSAPQGGSANSAAGARYQFASADGTRVFFTDGQRLTEGSTAGGNGKPDLYMCEVELHPEDQLACDLTDLTANTLHPTEPANVQGAVIGGSADGSSVYFVADGALTENEGAVSGDCAFSGGIGSGECNLYRYDTETSNLRFLAVLSGADFPDWAAKSEGTNLSELTARVSPSGRYLAFMSRRSLTGYDNRDAKSGARDQEVYEYDSQAGRLWCASCNPSAERPLGQFDSGLLPFPLVDGHNLWEGQTLAGSIPGWTSVDNGHALYQSRYLSDSGRLFFNAADALVPADSNGTEDVYQYEPPGVGSCTEASPAFAPRNGGCLDLISSGTSATESAFMDADEKGENVFFLTASRLTARDEDTALDLYDARVGGGETPPLKPVECSGDACQQPATPPNHPTPGTALVNGPGNLLQCPKNKVKRSGKCVAKHHKKKHPKKNHKAKKSQTKRSANNHRRASR